MPTAGGAYATVWASLLCGFDSAALFPPSVLAAGAGARSQVLCVVLELPGRRRGAELLYHDPAAAVVYSSLVGAKKRRTRRVHHVGKRSGDLRGDREAIGCGC